MLEGLLRVEGGSSALLFVRMFYETPSECFSDDATGTVHTIPEREGGEQGDALMPLLFSVGQHSFLENVGAQLRNGEHLFASCCWAVWGSEALHAQASQPPKSCFSVGTSLGRQPRPAQLGSG